MRYASGDGNDTVYGFNDDDTLHITKGNYSITKSGNDFVVKVGKNSILIKDAVFNSNRVTIKNSKGKVAVYNNWSNIKSGTSGDNILYNSDFNVTISGGAGNDSIYNRGENVIIDGGAGDDSISNSGENVTISGGAGNDSIYNRGGNVSINGGADNDSISNSGENVTINGGADNDSISNSGENVTINGGAGDDYISILLSDYYSDYTKNSVVRYASGDGNDTIVGFNDDDTLHITKGSYTTVKSGNDFIVKVGKNSVTLKDALTDDYRKINIKNSLSKVSTYNDWKIRYGSVLNTNYAQNVTLAGSNNNDTISNSAEKVLITSGEGNDSIENLQCENVTINGGAGNDEISNSGGNVTISGGVGDDTIQNYGENNLIQYASGDGNDTIYGFNSDDTLHITKGSYSVKASGDDVIVTVDEGKIILQGTANQEISIKDSSGKVITETYTSSSSELFAENNFMTSDNLSELVKNDLTTTDYEIKSKNFENLTQENNFLTFADK